MQLLPRIAEIELLGIRFHKLTVCELIKFIVRLDRPYQKLIVGNVNINAMNYACELPWYKQFINQCDLVFCDGFGVLLAAKLLGHSISAQHRMTCPDYIECLAKACERENRSLFLLAGQPGVVEKAIAKLHKVAPNLKVQGHHGFFEKAGAENEAIISKINCFSPDILYIGFGMPLQERWILDNIDQVNARVFLPLGGCLDFYTDTVRRGPKFLTDSGLEWLSRLVIEPRRLWSRYIIGNTMFFYRVIKALMLKYIVYKK